MKNCLRLLSTILLLTGCGSPPKKPDMFVRGDYTYLKTYLTWLIESEMRKQGVDGLSIAVVDDKQLIWAQGFGNADAANKVAATPQTRYRVGSISKLFTDTLVMQLAEQGKLDIDRPLTFYLPEFSIKTRFPNAKPMTLRQIMTHHSGLPGDVGNGMWNKNPEPFGKLVGQLKDEYVAYPPDMVLAYSNLGLTLLGCVLEKVTGTPFGRYAGQQLLKPLGMDNAVFSIGVDGMNLSKAYKFHQEKPESPLRDIPAGGLSANVLDMGRFMKMVLADGKANGRQILKPETIKTMLSPQNSDVALDVGQHIGLGWFLRDHSDMGTIAAHGGATLYHNSLLSLLPEQQLGVVILSNSPSNGLLQKINDETLKLALAAKSGRAPAEVEEPELATRALTAQELESLAGQYASVLGYVNLQNDGGRVVMELNGSRLDLVARTDGKYGIRYRFMGLIPIQPDELAKVGLSLATTAGHDLVLAHIQDQTIVVGEKIKPTPIPAAWQKRIGDYQIINLRAGEAIVPEKCALREKDGFLVLEYSLPELDQMNQTIAIKAVSDNEAVILGLGRGMGETVYMLMDGDKELMAYSGYLLRKQ